MIELTFLGTTAGKPTRDRGHPAIALKHNGEILLFDCGENTQRQLIHADLSPMKIDRIFITHWHADHFAGLLGLIQTMSLQGRTRPLYIYGPKKTKKFIDSITKLGHFHLTFSVKPKELEGEYEIVAAEPGYTVYSTPVIHGVETLAYRFEEPEKPGKFDVKKAKSLGIQEQQFKILQAGKSVRVPNGKVKPDDVLGPARKGLVVVYSGDTGRCENLIELAKGADLLIHESTYTEELGDKAQDRDHSTAKQAAEAAKKAQVKKLILTHISGRYKDPKPLLDEAKQVFKNTEIAEDLMKVALK